MPRPQFSLRSLFILTAIVAVCSTVIQMVRNAHADSIQLRLEIIVLLLSVLFVSLFLAAWK